MADCLALLAQENPELAALIEAWPKLSEPLRQAVLAIVASATSKPN
ncbi:MAG: hypothetical protein K1X71_17585 [Pirellulales bacterium]|nr:hypothetical protein [Pirellulales bacterium]